MAGGGGGEKTEKATPKKRRDERKKGNVFLSKDAVAVATLFGAYAVIRIMAPMVVENIKQFLTYCMGQGGKAGVPLSDTMEELGIQGVLVAIKCIGILSAVVILCAIAATFAQTRFLVSGQSLKPKFNRISPLQGMKRLFSFRSIVEALKGILKITLLLIVIYTSLEGMLSESAKYLYQEVGTAAIHTFDSIMSMILKVAVAFAVLAAADYFYQWWDYEKKMKMSKQEIKEEYKQIEGNPQIKSKIREVQRRMAQSRMMQQVPKADVVVRNPTHYAVALRYKPETDAAPIILAMGQDQMAFRIIKTAEENRVAVVENVALARALYASGELNREIPPDLYSAVAEVLVYIFRLNHDTRLDVAAARQEANVKK